MSESKAEDTQNVPKNEPNHPMPLESKVQLFFFGLLNFSFIGYFALRQSWIGFIFAHMAALGIMGFYGCLAGTIAKNKGYRYSRAFQLGFFLPIIFGAISAFLWVPAGEGHLPLTCGGWVSLAAGIVVVIAFAVVKKRDIS